MKDDGLKETIANLQGETFYTWNGQSIDEVKVCGMVPHPKGTHTLLVSYPVSGKVFACSWKRFIFAEDPSDFFSTKLTLLDACIQHYEYKRNKIELLIEGIAHDEDHPS